MKSHIEVLESSRLMEGSFEKTTFSDGAVVSGREGGTYISPIIEVPFSFYRVFTSWAARSAENGHMYVSGAFCDDSGCWSCWYDLGEWPSVSCETGLISDSMAQVATDVLVMTAPGKAFRAKIDFDGPGEQRVRKLALCFTNGLPQPEPAAKEGLFQKVLLDVPFISQTSEKPSIARRICGPVSLAMILRFHGLQYSPETLAWEAFDYRNQIFGNWSYLAALAGEYGMEAVVKCCQGFQDIEDELRCGYPAIISIAFGERGLDGAPVNSTPGHLIVVTGITAEGNICCNDPAGKDESEGRVIYCRKQLSRAWLGHGGIMIVFRPGKLAHT